MAESEPGDLNPGKQITAYDQVMALYTSLTDVATDGTVTMAAADSVTSDDATTWTIKLKDGWTFHNGEPVTSSSYVDAWNATAYGPNAWANSGQLAEIAGYDDLNPESGKPTTDTMSGLAVVDDLTFTVTLSAPDGQFPLQLSQAQTGLFPIPESAFDDLDAYNLQPVGQGPYMMTEPHQENEDITVVAYDDYAGTAPLTESIVFKNYADTSTAYNDVLAGNVDVAGVAPAKIATAMKEFGDHFYANPAPGIAFLGLPLWDERYDDVRVRQAISMAIDRDTINDVIYGGQLEPATAFTPPTEPGTPEGVCGEWCTYDPTKAKQLLEEAGGWSGEMVVTYPGGFGLDELYKAYANQLRQNLGIDEVTTKSTADFAEFAELRADAKLEGPYFSRWGALYPSQQNTLRAFFVPGGGGGCTNCSASQPDEVVDLLEQADGQVDQDAAIALYGQAQEILAEQLPIIPMFYEKYMFVTSDKVSDFPSSQGSPVWSQVAVSS
ncbi:ABC transporter substrate-binding protein [Nocardioides flavescens]|uniref:ABC transporter substrate-binding protein n=1 Tax=Nocardioides flavescens TaxID=2691959 RepID=UPI001925ABE4